MIRKRRLVITAVVLALATTACGDDGESDVDRAAIVERIDRLTADRSVAECIAEEFDGAYTVADIDEIIASRGNYGSLDFQLVEDFSTAKTKCTTPDDGE